MKPTKLYQNLILDLKRSITQSRYHAARLANQSQLLLYLRIGKMISERITREKWGTNILERVSEDLQGQLPGLKGFSARNLRNMKQFSDAYERTVIWQTLSAKLENGKIKPSSIEPPGTPGKTLTGSDLTEMFFGLSFSHHILILNKCSTPEERLFYIRVAATEMWTYSVLEHKVEAGLFQQNGKLPNNFSKTISGELTPSAKQIFNDEYLLNYLDLGDNDDERELENKIVANIRDFILRMGKGFTFIGNQFRVELAGDEFFIDLLFFNRYLQCLVAFELKKGKFKPEYAGQLNFYLNVLDEKIKLPQENNSIGIILCKEKNNTVVEYSVKAMSKAMGVATYRTTKELPGEMKGIFPDTADLVRLL